MSNTEKGAEEKANESQFNSLIDQMRVKYHRGEITIKHIISFVGLSRGERDADVSPYALARFRPDVDLGGHD